MQVANVSSGAGSLSSKVTFVDDAEKRKTMPFATQVMAYKMSKVILFPIAQQESVPFVYMPS